LKRRHPERPGRILAARVLVVDPDDKPRHFGDVMLTGKLLSPNIYFQIENGKLIIIGENMPQMDLSCIASNIV
jgi:hypothetical protein